MTKLGDNIKKLRLHNKLTLAKLSELSGVGQSTINDIENGKAKNPKTDTLTKLADALGVNINELLCQYWDDSINTNQVREEVELYETGEFKTAEAAMQFILKQPAIMGYGGFDADKLSKEEIIEFANELLNQLQLLGLKYKK
ncbi:helix-turn-helix transcriptional regulator [Clostridium sp. D46t1_190503_E9]|uniref:helix-turn-helix domain-containing protein n=1 Tax=Clostridium sp. D46t1_190503_E9 TaxID=2787137 RepID=UPI00189817D0|nr:helix-turn-helix transcriptional regulator [Clostridium sp. D46t1_190503_E9]